MPTLPAPSADYTDRDFDSLRARLISLLKSVFPDWSDFDSSTFGNLLLELFSFVGDALSYYLDNLARESRLTTATQRANVMALARMLSYRLHGATAATAEVEFRLTSPPAAAVIIPAGTVVRTQEVTQAIRYQLLGPAVIAANADPPRVLATVECSTSHTQLVDARGLADFEAHLDYAPYLDGSARVTSPQGAFTEVDSFLNSRSSDLHFVAVVDQNDRAVLRFGTGVNGTAPAGTVTISYKTGGGASGNVDADRIVVLEGNFSDAFGRAVQVTVRNPKPASGGAERESIAAAKMLAPEGLRALTRSVSREDFEINARRVPSVARALMLSSNEDPSIRENSGILFIVPRGGGLPTPALKAQVLRQVTEVYPHTITFQPSVQDPVYRVVDVYVRLFVREGYRPGDVRDGVRANLRSYFRISNDDGTPNPDIDFGHNLRDAEGHAIGEIAWSDIFNCIRDSQGVRKIGDSRLDLTLSGLPADLRLAVREFPVLGTVAIRDGDTGELL